MLDSFFGNVCELDLVFNFYKVRGLGLQLGDWNVMDGWMAERRERMPLERRSGLACWNTDKENSR